MRKKLRVVSVRNLDRAHVRFMAAREARRLRLFLVTCAAITAAHGLGLSPPVRRDDDDDDNDWRVPVLDVCRTIVRDVQPFVFVVYLLRGTGRDDDGLLRLVHDTVGTSVVLQSADNGGGEPKLDGQAALMVADGPDALLNAIDRGPNAVWDPMSHYVWLMPAAAVGRAKAKTLFRAAWRRRNVVNAVIVQANRSAAAYTYNPFRDALARHHPVDADALRAVARHKMTDLNGHAVRVCMFPTRLNAVVQPDGTYKGTDGMVVSTLAKHMNFTPVYSLPSDGKKYGWAEPISKTNFTYTGLLGDLVHNRVDMAFNGAFLNVMISRPSLHDAIPERGRGKYFNRVIFLWSCLHYL